MPAVYWSLYVAKLKAENSNSQFEYALLHLASPRGGGKAVIHARPADVVPNVLGQAFENSAALLYAPLICPVGVKCADRCHARLQPVRDDEWARDTFSLQGFTLNAHFCSPGRIEIKCFLTCLNLYA